MSEDSKKIWKSEKSEGFSSLNVLTTPRLNATSQRWGANLADFNFDIQYRPGQQNKDAQDKKDVESTAGPEAYSGT